MSATIRIAGMEATVTDYRWQSRSAMLARVLNGMLHPLGPSGADPNPDYHAALEAAEALGGELVRFDETEYQDGVTY